MSEYQNIRIYQNILEFIRIYQNTAEYWHWTLQCRKPASFPFKRTLTTTSRTTTQVGLPLTARLERWSRSQSSLRQHRRQTWEYLSDQSFFNGLMILIKKLLFQVSFYSLWAVRLGFIGFCRFICIICFILINSFWIIYKGYNIRFQLTFLVNWCAVSKRISIIEIRLSIESISMSSTIHKPPKTASYYSADARASMIPA